MIHCKDYTAIIKLSTMKKVEYCTDWSDWTNQLAITLLSPSSAVKKVNYRADWSLWSTHVNCGHGIIEIVCCYFISHKIARKASASSLKELFGPKTLPF